MHFLFSEHTVLDTNIDCSLDLYLYCSHLQFSHERNYVIRSLSFFNVQVNFFIFRLTSLLDKSRNAYRV
jgi:hypothetical protein